MSFYNTGNPVPSVDPRDLDDNAKILDEFVSSTFDTYSDRLGVARSTLAGIESRVSPAISLRADLANPDSPNGASLVGYAYTGSGSSDSDVREVLNEIVSVARFGVSPSNTGSQNTTAFQNALTRAADEGFDIIIPWQFDNLDMAGSVFVDHTMISNQRGVSIRGSSTRRNKITYTGSGAWLNITGLGAEGGTPLTQFDLMNFRVTGANNATSTGGIYLDRVNRVKLFGLSIDSFANSSARLLEIRNYFNVEVEKFNLSGGASLPQGQYGLVYGSKNSGSGDEWNSSNLKVRNGLIQRMAGKGAVLIHDGNICDNVEFDHVSFGANSLGSLSAQSSNLHNISVKHCHLESCGTQPDGSFIAATHVDIRLAQGVSVFCNESKDAQIHVNIDQCKAITTHSNVCYESGNYTIVGSIGVNITGVSGNTSQGTVSDNNVYTTQIDIPYQRDDFSDIDPGTHQVSEAAWASEYASNAEWYGKNLLFRKELNSGNPDGQYDRVWLSPELTWLRVVLASRHVGWGTTFPTSGSYTQGDIVFNETPTNQGSNTIYTNLGWHRLTTGSAHVAGTDWVSMRCLTGLVSFSASYNSAEPLRLGGNYWWHDTFNMPRTKSSAPASATDGNPFGLKVAVPSTATSAGAPGQWAADLSFSYFYTGDGTTHTWRRVATVSW